MKAWELCSTGVQNLVYSTSKVWHPHVPEYPDRIMISRRITGHTGQENDRGWSPPFSLRLFKSDYSLLRVNLLSRLHYGDVRDALKIPGNRLLLHHIW